MKNSNNLASQSTHALLWYYRNVFKALEWYVPGKLDNHLSEFLDGIYSRDSQSYSESRWDTRTTVEIANELYYTNLNAWDGGLCALLCPQEILTHPRFGRR